MNDTHESPSVEVEAPSSPPASVIANLGMWATRLGRFVSRLWVVGLLVTAAMGSGVALNQMFQAEMRLQALRQEPGPDAYAVVAYRRELARQIEAYKRARTAEVVPQPPPRPRLLEEIDIARRRNQDLVFGGAAATAPTLPVVSAPE
jgi:hypothetical protein